MSCTWHCVRIECVPYKTSCRRHGSGEDEIRLAELHHRNRVPSMAVASNPAYGQVVKNDYEDSTQFLTLTRAAESSEYLYDYIVDRPMLPVGPRPTIIANTQQLQEEESGSKELFEEEEGEKEPVELGSTEEGTDDARLRSTTC